MPILYSMVEIKRITDATDLGSMDKEILVGHFLKNFSMDDLEKFLSPQNSNSSIIGLFEGENLLSFLLLIQFDPRSESIVPKEKLWLERVFTKEEYRSKGYASKLVTYAERVAKHEMKYPELWLDTATASSLYGDKLGYTYQFSLPWKKTFTKFYRKSLEEVLPIKPDKSYAVTKNEGPTHAIV